MVASVKVVNKPLLKTSQAKGLSISALLNKDDKATVAEQQVPKQEVTLKNHFSDNDVKAEWTAFLKQLQYKDQIVFNAIKTFKLDKKDETTILIFYPSDSAKSEFDKISFEFLKHFRKKVNNFAIEFEYQKDTESLKIEVVTKKTIFDKFVKINPLLKELDDFLKFDFS